MVWGRYRYILENKARVYGLLIGAFVLKSIGGSWDVAYHFKYLREFYQIPHILNGVGDVGVVLICAYLWRTIPKSERGPIKIVLAGIATFVFGIGFDQWYHARFGLDLTIWSPAHITLYLGTFIGVMGTIRLVAQDHQMGVISLRTHTLYTFVLLFLVLEAFWFLLIQQEQGVITDYYLERGVHVVSDELFLAFFGSQRNVYAGIPYWVYGAWGVFSLVAVFNFAKRLRLFAWSSTIIAAEYVLFRFLTNGVYAWVAYPTSTVPYYIIPMAIIFDGAYLFFRKQIWWQAVLPNACIVIGIALVGFIETTYPLHPPIPEETVQYAIPAAFLGYFVAELLFRAIFSDAVFRKKSST